MINLHERMLPTSAGVEPATPWSPVGRRIHLSYRARLNVWLNKATYLEECYLLEIETTGSKKYNEPSVVETCHFIYYTLYCTYCKIFGQTCLRLELYNRPSPYFELGLQHSS